MHAEYDHCGFSISGSDLLSSFDSVEIGHPDIEYGNVRVRRGCQRNGLSAVLRFSDNDEVILLFEEQSQATTQQTMVVAE
jgi:hypothetical protein